MGREGCSRGTTQVNRPSSSLRMIHFALTNISLPDNAGIAPCTTDVQRLRCNAFTQEAQEGTSTGFRRMRLSALLPQISGGFRQSTFLCHCLIYWGRLLRFIICKNGAMSRLGESNNSHLPYLNTEVTHRPADSLNSGAAFRPNLRDVLPKVSQKDNLRNMKEGICRIASMIQRQMGAV